MNFTIDDLKNPNTFATLIGKGEETEEYETLTGTGEQYETMIEDMEEILEEESEDYPFKTLVDTIKENMEDTQVETTL